MISAVPTWRGIIDAGPAATRLVSASPNLLRPNQVWIPVSRRIADPVDCFLAAAACRVPIHQGRSLSPRPDAAVPDSRPSPNMQVGRPFDDDLRRFRGDARVAVAPVGTAFHRPAPKTFVAMLPVEEIRLDVGPKTLCQERRRSDLQRQGSLEDIRPASPMAGKPKDLSSVGRVHRPWTEVESEPDTAELSVASGEHLLSFSVEDAGSFRSMEVLTCFRSEVRRGLRLLLKAATAEQWHMCWAVLLSMFLLPMILTLMVVAGVGFVVLSTWVAIAATVVYPLAYINPRLYSYATDS